MSKHKRVNCFVLDSTDWNGILFTGDQFNFICILKIVSNFTGDNLFTWLYVISCCELLPWHSVCGFYERNKR